jgi:hypothetical protein
MLTKETINGKDFNVVWHKSGYSFAKGTKYSRIEYTCHQGFTNRVTHIHVFEPCGKYALIYEWDTESGHEPNHIATALPALPRFPKPEHARLLHLYAAHGVDVLAKRNGEISIAYNTALGVETAYLTYNNQRIEDFAITD